MIKTKAIETSRSISSLETKVNRFLNKDQVTPISVHYSTCVINNCITYSVLIVYEELTQHVYKEHS